MTLSLDGLAVPGALALKAPAWGIDPSTQRMAFGAIMPEDSGSGVRVGGARVGWWSIRLSQDDQPHRRWCAAVRTLDTGIRQLRDSWGDPALILVEQPFSGGHHTEPVSFYAVACLLAVLGNRLPGAEVEMVPPPSWKKVATGHGIGVGIKALPQKERYKAEKARLLLWAQNVAGYTGERSDEADAIGVATAAAVRLERRERVS